jgi:hypothetical protein
MRPCGSVASVFAERAVCVRSWEPVTGHPRPLPRWACPFLSRTSATARAAPGEEEVVDEVDTGERRTSANPRAAPAEEQEQEAAAAAGGRAEGRRHQAAEQEQWMPAAAAAAAVAAAAAATAAATAGAGVGVVAAALAGQQQDAGAPPVNTVSSEPCMGHRCRVSLTTCAVS